MKPPVPIDIVRAVVAVEEALVAEGRAAAARAAAAGQPEASTVASTVASTAARTEATIDPKVDAAIGELPPELGAVALGAAAAVASRFLAVGTPRSIGLIGDNAIARAALAAHRVLFAPRDVRCADLDDEAAADLAVATGGRVASLEQACASDIVCVAIPAPIRRAWLRGGTHLNALAGGTGLEPAVLTDSMLVVEGDAKVEASIYGTLAEIAAGFKDGRQLDEISVFLAGDVAWPRKAIAILAESASRS